MCRTQCVLALAALYVGFVTSSSLGGQRDKKVFREDYSNLEATEGFYKIHTMQRTWAEAKLVCALEGASLYYPDNNGEANAVISFLKSTQPDILEVYLGLSDIMSEGQFETVDGKSVSEVYTQWKLGEPNDSQENEDCVTLYLNGDMNDVPCEMKASFICKKSLRSLESNYNSNVICSGGQRDKKFFREDYSNLEATEGFYKIHTMQRTWAEAKLVCALEGASLYYPDNNGEANAVISFLKSTQPDILEVYLGLSDIMSEGQFETVDGKSVSEVYTQWKLGEPNDSQENEDCVTLYLNGDMNDVPCEMKASFICKKSLRSLESNYNSNVICSGGQRDKKFFREDYSNLEATEGFYKIHTMQRTWAEAKLVCALEGASLYYPDNNGEANAVISFLKSTQPDILEVYLGLSDIMSEGQFETVDGKSVSEVYTQWKLGEPNDSQENEDCVTLYLNGDMNDVPCEMKASFICKKSLRSLESNYNSNVICSGGQRDKKFFREDYSNLEATEGFYKIHTMQRTWAEAKSVCALEGASLYYPDNNGEANAVISFLKSTQPDILEVYLGLSDIMSEGQFETVDGKSVSEVYTQWKLGEPNDSQENEDCVTLYLNGDMNDVPCEMKASFICKKSLRSLESNYNSNVICSGGQRDKKFFREDYSNLEATEGFYKIHTMQRTWAEAKSVCALEGASLYYPDNNGEANAVISFLKSTQPDILEVYLGLSDIMSEGQFETVDGKSVSEVYTQWKLGEPNDSQENEDCVTLYLNGDMNDVPCEMKASFICKKSLRSLESNYNSNVICSGGQRDKKFFREDYSNLEATEGFYKIHTMQRTWAEAKSVCALEGASLYYPDNNGEANAVISFLKSTQPDILEVYLGLSDIMSEGQFETVDGKSVSEVYTQWKLGEPNDSQENEDCVTLYLNGDMNDVPCEMKASFICKKSLLSLESNYNSNVICSGGQRDKKFFREDYSNLEATEGFYKIHTMQRTWAEAKSVCALEGASLYYPDNNGEANAVISFLKSTQPDILEVYLGLSDIMSEGQFETVDGKSVSEVYTQWKLGEPNDSQENEDCVTLYLNGDMNDVPCEMKASFICKKSLRSLESNYNSNVICSGTPMNVDADARFDNHQPDRNHFEECGSMFFNGRPINTDCNTKSMFICEHEVDSSDIITYNSNKMLKIVNIVHKLIN